MLLKKKVDQFAKIKSFSFFFVLFLMRHQSNGLQLSLRDSLNANTISFPLPLHLSMWKWIFIEFIRIERGSINWVFLFLLLYWVCYFAFQFNNIMNIIILDFSIQKIEKEKLNYDFIHEWHESMNKRQEGAMTSSECVYVLFKFNLLQESLIIII